MKQSEAFNTIREFGCTVRKNDGEYRVCPKESGEGAAYYTDDLADAVTTAQAMRESIELRRDSERVDLPAIIDAGAYWNLVVEWDGSLPRTLPCFTTEEAALQHGRRMFCEFKRDFNIDVRYEARRVSVGER